MPCSCVSFSYSIFRIGGPGAPATALLAAAFLLVAFPVVAQSPTVPRPSTIEPGLIQERVEPPKPPSRALELPEIKEGAPEAVPDAVRSATIFLREVYIAGATAISVARLQALVAPYINRLITGAEVFELARVLTAAYRNEGYILSQVIVPPQSLTEGILTLRVVEGYIANVRIEGDPAAAPMLRAVGEKIKASRPLKAADLERYLLIANDLPGIQLRSVLSPSQTQGAADLTLIATERRIDSFASLDNYGSKYLGPGQLTAGVGGAQLLGANDQWRVFVVTTGSSREMLFGQLAYSQMLTADGLKVGASVAQTRTRPGDILEPFEIRGRAGAATVSLAYPIVRTRNEGWSARALYDHRDVNTDMLRVRVIEDRIRAVRAGLTWTILDRLDGQNALDVEASQGVGGTRKDDPLASRAGADSNFTKATFDYERFQRFASVYGLTVGFGGQWTNEPLLTSEQYALGGRRFGRAYEPAELVGDRALAARAEAVYFGRASSAWLGSYQLYVFYDIGKVWNKTATGIAPQSLASAGLGTRTSLGRYLNASLEVAWPLTKPVASHREHGNDARILGSLTARF